MIVSFVETMRGTVRETSGGDHPLDFEIKAEAKSMRDLLSTGQSRICGLVHAEPWVQEGPAEGTLEISLPQGKIAYHLDFQDRAGHALQIDGVKNFNWRAPLHSMTHLPITVRERNGAVLARGEVTFDFLRYILPFAASWLPYPRKAQLALDVRRRAVERRVLVGA